MTTRKFNPAWPSAQADTPERKAAAQRDRYRRQTERAKELGFSSWAALVTAILDGSVTINPTKNSSNIAG